MKNKNAQKGPNNILLLVVFAGLLIAGALFLLTKNGTSPSSNLPRVQKQTAQTQKSPQAGQSGTLQAIQNQSDLDAVTRDLDATNIDGLNAELGQLDTDARSFTPRIRLKNGASLNWAGYAIETSLSNPQNNAVSDVKGSWIVPTLICTSANTYSAAWVGIDGYSDNSVEQTGTSQDCINGQPRYSAWFEMYPKPSMRINLAVNAGDTMSAEVQYIGKNQFKLTLTNQTTHQTFSTVQRAKALRQSAEWIMEAPWSGGTLPLANFGTMQFSNALATLNGHQGTISDGIWQNDQITMTSSSGTAKATPSNLFSDGSSFNITWNSN